MIRRRALSFLAATAAVLAVACVIAWPVSYWRTFAVEIILRPGEAYFVGATSGSLIAGYEGSQGVGVEWIYLPTDDVAIKPGLIGFRWQFDSNGNLAGLPLWLVAAALAWLAIVIRKRARVRPEGLCPVCGYDLRATGDRCPECGTAVPTPTAATMSQAASPAEEPHASHIP